MIPWGTIIGGALGIGSAILGGAKASDAARKAKENNERMQRENQTWYDRRYNEDPTQRADAQRILTRTAELIKQRNKAAAGAAAVTGGTEESLAATKEANAKALSDAASQIAANGAARKDRIEEQYMATKRALMNQDSAIEQQRANAIAKATGSAGTALTKAGMGVDGMLANGGGETQPGSPSSSPASNIPTGNMSQQEYEEWMRNHVNENNIV